MCECDEQDVLVEVFELGRAVHVRFSRSEGIATSSMPTSIDGVPKGTDEFRSGSDAIQKDDDKLLIEFTENEAVAYR